MNSVSFEFGGATFCALGSGALYWPAQSLLCVSDLHLGKSERIARRGGPLIPPYEVRETLEKLQSDIEATAPATVICLGDSFDDPTAATSLPEAETLWITRLQAGRHWVWIEGNHDPGPVNLGGSHAAHLTREGLVFRHIASKAPMQEISGHYHPKTTVSIKGRRITRPCFLFDQRRLILPAYGVFTGGLRGENPILSALFSGQPDRILTGKIPIRL